MTQRWLLHLAFAFALLFAQQGAALHALSHLAEGAPAQSQSQQEKHLPHSPACDKCVAYAGMGSAAAPAPLAFDAKIIAGTVAAAVLFPAFSAPLHAYRSRAPPRQK